MFKLCRLLPVLLAGLALLLAACGGDDEEGSPAAGGSPGASPAAGGATVSPPSATQGCNSASVPPSQGEGPDDLAGRITFVRLVFGCQPDVYIMDANGDRATALANDPAIDDEADLSPDGSRVVFFSGRDGNAYLYIVGSDGSNLTRLTEGAGGDVSPRWSPDGSKIAFSRSGNLMVMNADGSDQHVIMEAQDAAVAQPCRAGSFVGGWSPDGKQLTYYAAIVRSNAPSSYWVCSINADGSDVKVLVGEPTGKLHAEPYWSPDGKKIVFRDDRDGDCSTAGTSTCNYDIFVLDLETGEQTNVTKHPSLDIEPAFSPDSQWIVFASNREDPNFDLYVVHPDGTGLQRLLSDPEAKDSYPSWR